MTHFKLVAGLDCGIDKSVCQSGYPENCINCLSKKFLLFILGEANVKKIYFLELDQDSYTKEAKNRIPEIIENITDQKVNRTEFFKLFENKQLKFSTLYEVSKY